MNDSPANMTPADWFDVGVSYGLCGSRPSEAFSSMCHELGEMPCQWQTEELLKGWAVGRQEREVSDAAQVAATLAATPNDYPL
jgi:hypothetical protein